MTGMEDLSPIRSLWPEVFSYFSKAWLSGTDMFLRAEYRSLWCFSVWDRVEALAFYVHCCSPAAQAVDFIQNQNMKNDPGEVGSYRGG